MKKKSEKRKNKSGTKSSIVRGIWFWLILALIVCVVTIAIDYTYNYGSLGLISNIMQVFTVAIAISAWLVAKDTLKKRKKVLEAAESGQDTVALIVDISAADSDTCGKGIAPQVKAFLANQGFIEMDKINDKAMVMPGKIPEKFNVEMFYSGKLINVTGFSMPEDAIDALDYVEQFKSVLKQIEQNLRNKGTTKILLFCSAPLIIPFFIGEDLKNNFNVSIYHYMRTRNSYIPLQ